MKAKPSFSGENYQSGIQWEAHYYPHTRQMPSPWATVEKKQPSNPKSSSRSSVLQPVQVFNTTQVPIKLSPLLLMI